MIPAKVAEYQRLILNSPGEFEPSAGCFPAPQHTVRKVWQTTDRADMHGLLSQAFLSVPIRGSRDRSRPQVAVAFREGRMEPEKPVQP